ncbi:HlyD family efflux transporter periplasmic adaptor subunit [Pantoea sp. BAV 3049]|uniref:HlyD family efflux transporter periplasmic adaptor subunit n=1 Tax=Pantoea sp. BAV 3049 TaxID=2654188 RepID=UPI001E49DAA9|nr:HlyD family efflux transporter periplasmic adaptor subunit [Pantoea sp. BAV 3049]
MFKKIKNFYCLIMEKITSVAEFCCLVFFRKNNTELYNSDDGIDEAVTFNLQNDVTLSRSVRIVYCIIFFITLIILWATFFNIDEVSKGNGKIIPSSKEQVIQSLDGGILKKIYVNEGDVIEAGAVLAQLDIIRTLSTVDESESKYRALLAQRDRLYSEANDIPLTFSVVLDDFPELRKTERRLKVSRKERYDASLKSIIDSRRLINNELAINRKLARAGASSSVDVIRLERQLVELSVKEAELKAEFTVKAREEMVKINTELSSLKEIVKGRKDSLSKMTITSPVRGIVKEIVNSSIGGVIAPNGVLMQIVPLDDNLVVEARISPRDIAFIHPGQHAKVKITAYDYSIYGGLDGEVVTISPDTIKDDQKPDMLYYRVYIRTQEDYLLNKRGKKLFISPGMVAAVDIKTGSKTVAHYLMKPFNKVNEALTER